MALVQPYRWVRYPERRANVLLIEVVVVLVVIGVLLWLINTYVPMAPAIKSLLNAVVVIAVIVWLLKIWGLWGYITHLRVGQ